MTDNVGYTPGAGALVAADDVDGVLYQRIKLSVGEDGVAQDVSGSQPLPVNIIADESMSTNRLLAYLDSPRGYDKALQRQRVTGVIESGTVTTVSTVTTVTTVTTVSSVANQVNIGGLQAQLQVYGINLSAWQACVRARIT